MSNLLDKSIEYLVPPASADEHQIATVLETIQRAVHAKDLILLASLLSEDARLTMYAENERLLTKKEYLEAMARLIPRLRRVTYKKVFIRVVNSDEAVVSCLVCSLLEGESFYRVAFRYYQFLKRDDTWRIARAEYDK